MSEPRDLPPAVVWTAVLSLVGSMWLLWPDGDSPRAATDVPVPVPIAGAFDERALARSATLFDPTTAEVLGLTLNARRQIERVFGNSLALDPVQRAALEIQIDALPGDPSRTAFDDVERALHRLLPPEQADMLFRLVRDYRDYVREVRQSVLRQDLPQTREEALVLLERIEAMQRMHFDDPIVLALFGSGDDGTRAQLAARLLRQSP
jgi:hypothetical protein